MPTRSDPAARTRVMGRSAALNTACIMGAVGLLSLLGASVSTTLERFGTGRTDHLWSAALILGAVFTLLAMVVHDDDFASSTEAAGLLCTAVGIGVLATALTEGTALSGALAVLGLCLSATLNLVARALLLIRDRLRKGRE